MRSFALSYCNLFCPDFVVLVFCLVLVFPVWLSSLGGLLFSEGKGAGAEVGYGEKGIGWQSCEECRAGILCLREHIF